MKTTFSYRVHFLLAALLVGVAACSPRSSTDIFEDDIAICRNSEFANFDEKFYRIDYEPWLTEGTTVNYDPDLSFLVLGYEKEGPDNEPHGGITLTFDVPEAQDHARCITHVFSATLSTNDVRVGTGEELNGKLYSMVSSPRRSETCKLEELDGESPLELAPNGIEFFYVSGDIAVGWFCVEMEQVSPESGGEPFKVGGYFEFRK